MIGRFAVKPPFVLGPFPDRANRIEDWPDGWYEYDDPTVHGPGNALIRRYFKNDHLGGMKIWVEESVPLPIFDGDFTSYACIEYFDKDRGVYWFIEDGGVEYEEGALLCRDTNGIPFDTELEGLIGGRYKTGDILFDMYGTACIFKEVDDELHAFKIAEVMAKRRKLRMCGCGGVTEGAHVLEQKQKQEGEER